MGTPVETTTQHSAGRLQQPVSRTKQSAGRSSPVPPPFSPTRLKTPQFKLHDQVLYSSHSGSSSSSGTPARISAVRPGPVNCFYSIVSLSTGNEVHSVTEASLQPQHQQSNMFNEPMPKPLLPADVVHMNTLSVCDDPDTSLLRGGLDVMLLDPSNGFRGAIGCITAEPKRGKKDFLVKFGLVDFQLARDFAAAVPFPTNEVFVRHITKKARTHCPGGVLVPASGLLLLDRRLCPREAEEEEEGVTSAAAEAAAEEAAGEMGSRIERAVQLLAGVATVASIGFFVYSSVFATKGAGGAIVGIDNTSSSSSVWGAGIDVYYLYVLLLVALLSACVYAYYIHIFRPFIFSVLVPWVTDSFSDALGAAHSLAVTTGLIACSSIVAALAVTTASTALRGPEHFSLGTDMQSLLLLLFLEAPLHLRT